MHIKQLFFIAVVIFSICGSNCLKAQENWKAEGEKLYQGDKTSFLSGVNYVPSYGWLTHLEIWDPAKVEEDLMALKEQGVKVIRYLPLWHQLQHTPDKGYQRNIDRVVQVVELAKKHGIYVQLGLLNSWMSGGTFLPEYAVGDIFGDKEIIKGQKALIKDLVSRFKGESNIQAYDIGNEINVLQVKMNLKDVEQKVIDNWMDEMYKTIKKYDPTHDVINGVGTGYPYGFNVKSISHASDLMASHSYPYFHGTSRLDSWLGLRTTYSTNFIISWAQTTGQPVVMQELGVSEQWMHPRDIPKYMNITFMSDWAEGAAGYIWWCSHDIDRDFKVADEGLYKEYSTSRVQRQNQFHKLNYDMGILDEHNNEKLVAATFRSCTDKTNELGMDWKDKLPVCYVMIPHDHEYEKTMIELITPFTLAKQAHYDVKLTFENEEIPLDADVLIVSDFALTETAKKQVKEFLNNGGIVYQSGYNDFDSSIKLTGKENSYSIPEFQMAMREGIMGLSEHLQVNGTVKLKEVEESAGAIQVMSLPESKLKFKENREHDTDLFEETAMKGVLFKTEVGKGTYYFNAANIETALLEMYNPWKEDNSNLIYSMFRPDSEFDIDNKYVELYHKVNPENQELLVMINHSDVFQDVLLYQSADKKLKNRFENGEVLKGNVLQFKLQPGEVLILDVLQ